MDRIIDAKIARARPLDPAEMDARSGWQQLRDAGARLFLPYL
jgi:hypothetical protein